jgi:hypothetical protein
MTAIEDLAALAPPPAEPRGANGDWGQVEAALGLGLPTDFKQLVSRYGLGQFAGFITPLTPFAERDLLVPNALRLLERERAFRDANPDKSPYPFYPEPGGLLEWAGTDNGDSLYWPTDGEPDTWTTVVWNPRSWRYDAHPVGAVEFLHGWLGGERSTTVFADYRNRTDDATGPCFQASRPRRPRQSPPRAPRT